MSDQNTASFHFSFWKERVWVWALMLPLGILFWGMPAAMLFALAAPNVPEGLGIFMALVLIGIPAYLVGYIFIYNFIEGVFTRVTITDQKVSFRTPWVIFPVLLVTKNIPILKIEQVRFNASYGIGRLAVQTAYQQGKRKRVLHLPQFKDDQYIQAMKALQERVTPASVLTLSSPSGEPQGTLATKDALINAKRYPSLRPRDTYKILNTLISFSFLALFRIGGWITLSLPISSKTDAFAVGFNLGFVFFWLAFCGFLPGIGQVAFWFLGHPIIRAILWLFQVPDVSWETPQVVNQLLGRWNISPIHSTLVEFLFWATLIISIELSITGIEGWLRRRAYK
jgi:hypothetical protein